MEQNPEYSGLSAAHIEVETRPNALDNPHPSTDANYFVRDTDSHSYNAPYIQRPSKSDR